MKDIRAKILSNEKICADYYKIVLDAPYIERTARPGQFVQVRCSDGLDPLLRRPFSIHRLKAEGSRLKGFEILYEVVGKGTEILSNKKTGDSLDVLGPLGTGFTLPPFTIHHSPFTILVAGGIGIAPLLFLAGVLAKQEIKTIVLIGAKTKRLILYEKEFKKTGAEVRIATEDGSRGSKGFVSDLFKKVLRATSDERRTTIYACGPNAMLKCIAEICRERGLDCEVSLEERMACGFGACLGCAVKLKGERGYKLACKDGPVFNATRIIWS